MDVAVGTFNLNNLFSREIPPPSRARWLFTIFNTHLESHFLPPGETGAQILAVELARPANWPKH